MREGSFLTHATLAGALVMCLGGPVAAQITSLEGTYGGGLQFGSGGAALTTEGNVTARSETSTRSVVLNGGARLAFYDDDTDVALNGRLIFNQAMPLGSLSFGASIALDPVTFETIDDDLGLTNGEGERTRLTAFGNWNRQINTTTQFATRLSYTRTDFDPVNVEQVPSDLFRGNARLNYQLDERTSLYGDLSLGWFTSELTDVGSAFENSSLTVDGTIGGTQELDSRTTFTGALGLSFVNIEEIRGGVTDDRWETALLIDAGVEQRFSDGVLNLGFSQEVSPTAQGELQQISKLTGGVSVEVNSTTEIGVNGTFTRQSGLGSGDASTGLTLSPFYSRELVEGVNATASYTMRNANDETSHRFNIGLNRSFGGPR